MATYAHVQRFTAQTSCNWRKLLSYRILGTGSSNLALNFKLEVTMWPFLHMRSRKLTVMAENVAQLPKC